MIDRPALKAEARLRMAESAPPYWKVMLVWFLAAVLAPAILQNVVANPLTTYSTLVAGGIDPAVAARVFLGGTAMVGLFLAIVLFLYQTVMNFGLANYALHLWRREPCGQSSLFDGFAMVGRVIGAQILVSIFTFLWAMLLAIPLVVVIFVAATMGGFGIVVVFAAYIAYIMGLIAIILRYALVDFALADDPALGALGAIQRSKDLMRGYKGAYFVLGLSFLGWMLLCGLLVIVLTVAMTWMTVGGMLLFLPDVVSGVVLAAAGLPIYLWLNPYMYLTTAGFYDALCPKQPPYYEPLNERPSF